MYNDLFIAFGLLLGVVFSGMGFLAWVMHLQNKSRRERGEGTPQVTRKS